MKMIISGCHACAADSTKGFATETCQCLLAWDLPIPWPLWASMAHPVILFCWIGMTKASSWLDWYFLLDYFFDDMNLTKWFWLHWYPKYSQKISDTSEEKHFLTAKMFHRSTNGSLVVWGPVVWIPRIPLWKGLLLRGIPRIPNHRAPNHQLTISWIEFHKKK